MQSLLKSGMLISHLRRPPFVYHQVSICKLHLTWSFLCPLICTHISLNFIPVTHLFSRSHLFDSPACIVHFAKLTAEKMAFIYITWSFLPFPCHTAALPPPPPPPSPSFSSSSSTLSSSPFTSPLTPLLLVDCCLLLAPQPLLSPPVSLSPPRRRAVAARRWRWLPRPCPPPSRC